MYLTYKWRPLSFLFITLLISFIVVGNDLKMCDPDHQGNVTPCRPTLTTSLPKVLGMVPLEIADTTKISHLPQVLALVSGTNAMNAETMVIGPSGVIGTGGGMIEETVTGLITLRMIVGMVSDGTIERTFQGTITEIQGITREMTDVISLWVM